MALHFVEANAALEERPRWKAGRMYAIAFDLVDPITCVRAVRWLARRYDWFAACVRDIRMLRIEENDDLMPALAAEF